jgi:ABC-type sugar transport system ATPase subunit
MGATPEPGATPLLEVVAIEKRFGAIEALRGASFTAERGELVGICGESGAGKSTLVKILGGVHPFGTYRGKVVVDGKELRLGGPSDPRASGIAVVHERPMLVGQLTVAHNLMLGREPRRFGLVDEPRLESLARAHLERFGLAEVL